MKKLLFVLLFFVVGIVNGQITYIDTTSTGNEIKAYASTKGGEGFQPLPVRSTPMGVIGTTATTKGVLDITPSTTSAAVTYTFTTHYLDIINNTDQVL